jgi:hypothetical protein
VHHLWMAVKLEADTGMNGVGSRPPPSPAADARAVSAVRSSPDIDRGAQALSPQRSDALTGSFCMRLAIFESVFQGCIWFTSRACFLWPGRFERNKLERHLGRRDARLSWGVPALVPWRERGCGPRLPTYVY